MKKLFIFSIIFLVLSSFVFGATGLFVPETPPNTPGILCLPTGCIVIGDSNYQGNSIFNVYLFNATLSGVTLENVTFVDIIRINATEVVGEFWVNESGDIMSGDLDMDGNNILNVALITADDWSNVTILENQISDLSISWNDLTDIPAGFADNIDNDTMYLAGIGLSLVGGTFNFNTTYGDNRYILRSEDLDDIACAGSNDIACVNKTNYFNATQQINNAFKLQFHNSSNYLYYNSTNQTLQLWVNGEIQQDWGESTTIYQEATFLADAIFENLTGEEVIFNGNLRITGYTKTNTGFIGNGTNITDVCHSDGRECPNFNILLGDEIWINKDNITMYFNETHFNNSVFNLINSSTRGFSWNDLTDIPAGFADNIDNDTMYSAGTGLVLSGGSFYLNLDFLNTNYINWTFFNWGNLSDIPVDIADGDNNTHWRTENSQYLYNDTDSIYFNESLMNQTNDNRYGLKEENVTISVSGGTGSGVTSICCNPSAEIVQVAVFPTTPTNKFRFSANGTISGEVVDTDRIRHDGDWLVGHRGVVLFNENINYYLTNVQTDESFNVRIRWRP